MLYTPPEPILAAYANTLVNWALHHGEGVRAGEVVLVVIPEAAKPLYAPLRNAILKAGAFPIMDYRAQGVREADAYLLASDAQLTFFPDKLLRGQIEQIDHTISIIAEHDKYVLESVPSNKIIKRTNAYEPYHDWRIEKEAQGKYTWTLAMYGTPAMAKDAGMTPEEYWQEIINACYLDTPDPVGTWRGIQHTLEQTRSALNALHIEKVHVEGEGVDLWVKLGENRAWLGGSGANLPSFELFISPDSRGTEGEIRFNQPLFRYGKVIKDIYLRFGAGRVVESSASQNQDLLEGILNSENGNRIGEFSLTDGRLSRITRPMGETLFDENMGGPNGNTHIALGNAYRDSYPGDTSSVTEEQWSEWGYNASPQHVDIISTAPRTVTALLPDGSTTVIYTDGKFTV